MIPLAHEKVVDRTKKRNSPAWKAPATNHSSCMEAQHAGRFFYQPDIQNRQETSVKMASPPCISRIFGLLVMLPYSATRMIYPMRTITAVLLTNTKSASRIRTAIRPL